MAGYGETSKGVSHMQNHTGISPIVFIYTSIMDVPWGRSVPKAAEFFKKGMETWKLKCLKKSISRNVTLVAEVDHGGQVYCVLRTYTHARSRPSRRTRKLVFVAYYVRFWDGSTRSRACRLQTVFYPHRFTASFKMCFGRRQTFWPPFLTNSYTGQLIPVGKQMTWSR